VAFQIPVTVQKVLEAIYKKEYVLPAIQREFVWDTDQVRALFDSLLRGYPIGSFLLWEVGAERAADFTFYGFLTDYHELQTPFAQPFKIPAGHGVTAVLDGQQRLTALNIGLYGSHAERLPYRPKKNPDAYPKRRLYLDLLSESPDEQLAMQYDFRFLTDAEALPKNGAENRWFLVGDVLGLKDAGPDIMRELELRELHGAAPFQCLFDLYRAIRDVPAINYYLEDSQDPNKVLDIFVRVNSGGTTLSYSDLLLSMATNQWETLDAREEVRSLLTTLNGQSPGFDFSKDILLKTGLILIGAPDIRFKVSNFTKENMALLEKRWLEVKNALILGRDLLASFGYSERTLTSDSVLIPLSYYMFSRGFDSTYLSADKHAEDRTTVRRWVDRSLMKRGVWGSGLDTLLGRLRDVLRTGGTMFPAAEIETAMTTLGKSLTFQDAEISELCDLEYGKRRTFPALAMLYPGLDLTRAFHEDHIFPKSRLTRAQLRKGDVPPHRIDDYVARVNKLANLQLLEGLPNIEKQAVMPDEWIGGTHFTSKAQRDQYLVSNDLVDLPLTLDGFIEFYEGRRDHIEGRFRLMLR
jgi:hypothetical protein